MWATSYNLSKLDKDQSGQGYLTIKTHKGLHHYKLGAIFGVSSAPATFQRIYGPDSAGLA